MGRVISDKEAIRQWRVHCEEIQTATAVLGRSETPTAKRARIARLLADYDAFVEYYFAHWITADDGRVIHNAPFHKAAAEEVRKNRNLLAGKMWARGHAKSTHFDVFIPMWLMQQPGQLNVMVLVSKSQEMAATLLGDLQAELQYNQRYIADFGWQYNDGSWEDGAFVTQSGKAFFARGRGQSPRGLRYRSKRPDYIIIDDLDDDELVLNPSRVTKLTKWVKEALFGCLDGGRGRFIMIGNLISKCSVLAEFCASKGVKVSQVNILNHRGEVSWASKWTRDEVRRMEEFMGYISFQRELMNNPITEGAVFRRDWIQWRKPYKLREYDQLIFYIDPSFKSSTKNDYKAGKLWGRKGTQYHHLKAFVRQCSITELVRWCYDLWEALRKANAVAHFYMEANFLQDTILDEFIREGEVRGYQLPITADRRKKPDKYLRIEAISPLWERGLVWYNINEQDNGDMQQGLAQTLAFEKGSRSHDDGPDADEGAIYLLQDGGHDEARTPILGRRDPLKHGY